MSVSQSQPCGAEAGPLHPAAPRSEMVIRGCIDGFELRLETAATLYAGQLISKHNTLSSAARALTVAKAALDRCMGAAR